MCEFRRTSTSRARKPHRARAKLHTAQATPPRASAQNPLHVGSNHNRRCTSRQACQWHSCATTPRAEVELGVDLFRVDLGDVVRTYIGETEKNLDRIFIATADACGIVFFDEAEALFGKRSEVHDSHDRYANIEVSFLLQKMKQFGRLAILTTNLRDNIEVALIPRQAFLVHFPLRDQTSRERIWRAVSAAPAGGAHDPQAAPRLLPVPSSPVRRDRTRRRPHRHGRHSHADRRERPRGAADVCAAGAVQ